MGYTLTVWEPVPQLGGPRLMPVFATREESDAWDRERQQWAQGVRRMIDEAYAWLGVACPLR